ncbi:acylphosphatase-2-like isoform X1 [Emydura macquarii macquarii]|uniref:acylphosphatase-2-like isoform X1 n=1 Tax=Emydura macquarii macquarii TaxID=1129001 RepID=UPI00352B61B2
MASSGLWALDYEVYGDVQGVFFRKYTEEQGKKLGVVGWVKNTSHGTVTGQVQGPKEKIEIMSWKEIKEGAGSTWTEQRRYKLNLFVQDHGWEELAAQCGESHVPH